MNSYVEQYTESLKQKDLSQSTLSSYISDLNLFLKYCSNQKIEYIHQIDAEFINGYLNLLSLNGKRDSSINRTLASLKKYFVFLKTEGYYFTDPSKDLKTKAVAYKYPDYLSESQINNLCDFGRFFTPIEYRDTLMIYLCTHMGLSVNEVCSLTLDNINLNVSTIKIVSSKHSRTVVLDDEAQKRMEHYINTLRPTLLPSGSSCKDMFLGSENKAISRQGFWKNLNNRCKKLKIKKKISPNNLKYSYLVKMIEEGVPTEVIQENMGYLDKDALRKCTMMLKEKYQNKERKHKRGK